MKIGEFAPAGKTGSVGKKKPASSASGLSGDFFGLLSAGEAENVSSLSAASDIQPVSMDGLLSLQEIPADELRKRQALQESQTTLETLESLRFALLSGSVPEHLLHTLTRVVAYQKEQLNDPRLMSIIEDIELRAAVELAKLERASQQG